MFGAISTITVRGLLYKQARRFITITLVYFSRIRYTGPPGFSAKEVEATGATEAVLGLQRVGGTVALGATLPRRGFK